MRYSRKVKVIVEDVSTEIDLVIDFEVVSSVHRLVVKVDRTQQRLALGQLVEAEWWWDLCPHRVAARMDEEMMRQWWAGQNVIADASQYLDSLLGAR